MLSKDKNGSKLDGLKVAIPYKQDLATFTVITAEIHFGCPTGSIFGTIPNLGGHNYRTLSTQSVVLHIKGHIRLQLSATAWPAILQ